MINDSHGTLLFYLGVFTVTPLVGEALNTNFKMSATEGWSDADGDTLQYQFAYTSDTTADAKYFSYTPQAESSFTSQLPTGVCQVNTILNFNV